MTHRQLVQFRFSKKANKFLRNLQLDLRFHNKIQFKQNLIGPHRKLEVYLIHEYVMELFLMRVTYSIEFSIFQFYDLFFVFYFEE